MNARHAPHRHRTFRRCGPIALERPTLAFAALAARLDAAVTETRRSAKVTRFDTTGERTGPFSGAQRKPVAFRQELRERAFPKAHNLSRTSRANELVCSHGGGSMHDQAVSADTCGRSDAGRSNRKFTGNNQATAPLAVAKPTQINIISRNPKTNA